MGPRTELHSGHYGNWAPNPAMSLARLLASMKDDSGRVLVEHFYDDVEPLGPVEKQALADAPAIDARLMQELWLGSTDGRPQTLNELITIPSLNIRGMASSRIGAQASNVIPSSAEVTIDVQDGKGMDGRKTGQQIVDHIRKQGFFVVDREPTADERRAHAKSGESRRRSGGRRLTHADGPADLTGSRSGPSRVPVVRRSSCRRWAAACRFRRWSARWARGRS